MSFDLQEVAQRLVLYHQLTVDVLPRGLEAARDGLGMTR
jgi:hypothetical protein